MNNQLTPQENPLKNFFRKSKFRITLPSAGRWYPPDSLKPNSDGTLDVFAMNANDDIRFRAGEITMSGQSTLDLVKSCLPGILEPESIPSIDIDSILLAIRAASYGDIFTTTISVPGTTLTRKLDLKVSDLLNSIPGTPDEWDNELEIESDTNMKLKLILVPINLRDLFRLTKAITGQQRALQNTLRDVNTSEMTEEQTQKFDASLQSITGTAVDLICDSIKEAKVIMPDGTVSTQISSSDPISKAQIRQLILNLDVAYFNAIRDHLDAQKKKYTINTGLIRATEQEIAAGAKTEWQADIVFGGSDFFGK